MTPPAETRPLRRRLLVPAVGVAAAAGARCTWSIRPSRCVSALSVPRADALLLSRLRIALATHQLLHGHLAAALRMNPLFVVSLPLLGLLWLFPRWQRKPWVGWLVLAVVIAYWIARNLPFWPLVLGPPLVRIIHGVPPPFAQLS